MLKKVNAIMLSLAVLLAFGCGEDEPEPENINNPTQEKCLITKAYAPGAGPNSVIFENFYDSNKRLIRQHNYSYSYVLFEYDVTGLVVTRKYYNKADSSLARYDISEYNQNGLLTKRTDFSRSGGSPT